MNHIEQRKHEFSELIGRFEDMESFSTSNSLAVHGDSLRLLKRLPDQSISLILTDPPYHSTKKSNISNDKAFKTNEDFLNWMCQYRDEWKRVLRPNGSIFMFCSSTMSAWLEVMFSEEFNVLSHIVWTKPNDPGFDGWKGKMKKEALRQFYPHSERILFMEPASKGNLKRSYFGNYLRKVRLQSGLSGHAITEMTGAYGKVNHGGAVSNWETGRNIPSQEQYNKICEAILSTEKVQRMLPYEDVVRKFDVCKNVEFMDVWDFKSVKPYKGKHPAEKPLDMLEHCINVTTFEEDIILDCFAGSGSMAIAALNTNRLSLSIELEDEWYSTICNRIKAYDKPNNKKLSSDHRVMKATYTNGESKQATLFNEPSKSIDYAQ